MGQYAVLRCHPPPDADGMNALSEKLKKHLPPEVKLNVSSSGSLHSSLERAATVLLNLKLKKINKKSISKSTRVTMLHHIYTSLTAAFIKPMFPAEYFAMGSKNDSSEWFVFDYLFFYLGLFFIWGYFSLI